MTRYAAIAEIRAALSFMPTECRLHGTDFARTGTEHGEPRCESCKQPWRVVRALAALDHLDARLISMQAAERENPALRRRVDELRASAERFAESVGRAVSDMLGAHR